MDLSRLGLTGATPEGGWTNELKPEDSVHTLVAVRTPVAASSGGRTSATGDNVVLLWDEATLRVVRDRVDLVANLKYKLVNFGRSGGGQTAQDNVATRTVLRDVLVLQAPATAASSRRQATSRSVSSSSRAAASSNGTSP